MGKNDKVKILYFLNDLANGGIETFCLNINKNIDRKRYKIDYFLTVGQHEYYKNDVESLGAKVFNINNVIVPKYIPNFMKIYYVAKKIIKERNYSIVHLHQCKGIISILLASYISKVKINCVHSHSAFIPKSNIPLINLKVKVHHYLSNILFNLLNVYRLGCSKEACRYMFEKRKINNSKTKVIFNGIELERFEKNKFDSSDTVSKYNIDQSKINFINIGRFEEQKNQLFLIGIFFELLKLRKDIELTIVGHGSLEEEIKDKINELGLEKNIDILPSNTNIPEILSVMDYFLLPSIYEGLGIVLIEAQSMGVQCFASNYVPEEANLGMCKYIPLEIGEKEWARLINDNIESKDEKFIDNRKKLKYDIKNVLKELEEIYLSDD